MQRRQALKALTVLGIGNAVFQRALAAEVIQDTKLTSEALRNAEWISGIQLSEEDRGRLVKEIDGLRNQLGRLRAHPIGPNVTPALHFAVGQPKSVESPNNQIALSETHPSKRPEDDATLAFLSVSELSALIRTRQLTSIEITQCYLRRLKAHGDKLKCIVTLTEDLALKQAKRADEEIASGRYRGPLHGIPWGAKDLIAYPGYPTTWGAPQYKDRILLDKATVAQRLDDAGAVLVAKLSLGALAMGDRWYGGMTRNPWDLDQGSSGSSAGSASATVAGLVGFALGSETLGSIISPSVRCGATGLRPTFGRVSRHGCMALSWSMDKIGPITRSVEDAALVLGAIHGADGLDPTAVDHPFSWPGHRPAKSIRLGYIETIGMLDTLNKWYDFGFQLVPVKLPAGFPVWDMMAILTAEAATSFHEFTRDGITGGLNSWPDTFRKGHFIPAVDYLNANRMRTQLMQAMEKLFTHIDVLVGCSSIELGISNLTGHPSVTIPNGFDESNGKKHPTSYRMTGRCFGETTLLQVAHAFQEANDHHRQHPPEFS